MVGLIEFHVTPSSTEIAANQLAVVKRTFPALAPLGSAAVLPVVPNTAPSPNTVPFLPH